MLTSRDCHFARPWRSMHRVQPIRPPRPQPDAEGSPKADLHFPYPPFQPSLLIPAHLIFPLLSAPLDPLTALTHPLNMDGLSGIASGMAVASLALQLLQSVNTVKAFIRNVKGASKELERLLELLTQLGSLLDDVRKIMGRQASLQQCPPPLQTIFNSLKTCESGLDELQSMARKHNNQQHRRNRTLHKLKDDVLFALKTKEITSFEERMQRNIDNLHASLDANATNIQYGIT